MKKLITLLTLALIVARPVAGFAQADLEKDPAYLAIDKAIDFKAIPPQVNVNLPKFLLKDAVANFSTSTNDPLAGTGIDLADLVKDVKLIRVVVIEATKTNRPALDKAVKALRSDLDSKWTAIVSVPENNVGIYAMGDPSGESTAGIAVLIYDKGQAVIVNVVGHVSIGKLLKIAAQSNKLPKEFFKNFAKGNQSDPQPAPAAAKPDGAAPTNPPVEAPETKPKEAAAK